ncbi:MAG TPA: pyridine nucleotide-disulfide oxidoreductase [Gammaproteobacteria bacterium]|nr:pyridine nucleotide-disulfide oxidoreductase [Gammaproteobacteria bacterium]
MSAASSDIPGLEKVSERTDENAKALALRRAAQLGYALAALAVWIGWLITRDYELVQPLTGLGYWLGVIGASLMATLLLYPVRKRIRWLQILGPTRHWFRLHMVFGVLGPVLILYHCNFSLGSLNDTVALACTLLVAVSGLVGRYLYTKIHVDLDGHTASLLELRERARISAEQRTRTAALVPQLLERMTAFDDLVLAPPQSLLASVFLPFKLAVQTRLTCVKLIWFVRRQLHRQARKSPVVHAERKRLQAVTNRFIREHLKRVRRVAELSSYERLFSLWHVFHLPFFYMLVVAAIIHVLAVHMY